MKHKKKPAKNLLVLLDAHAILHRAYHGMPNFATRDGRGTGALYGLVSMAIRIRDELNPEYIVACYDLPKPTFRHVAYDGYKQGRTKTDDTLVTQIEESKDVCAALGIPIYSCEGFEADDMLGTIVEQTKDDKDLCIVIASGDMDTMQLIDGDRIRVFTLKKGKEMILYNEEGVVARYGFSPDQIRDFKGLSGDPSDNITGVPGIGEKTATELIQKYGCIEAIYETLKENRNTLLTDGIKERAVKLLEDGEDEAIFSKTLATIRRDAPITFTLPDHPWLQGIDKEKYVAMCEKYEFRSLKHAFDAAEAKEDVVTRPEVNIDPVTLERLKVMVNLLDSETTNPDVETIQTFAGVGPPEEMEKKLEEKLKEEDLFDLYTTVELPLIPLITQMKVDGVNVDVAKLKKLSEELHEKILLIEKEIYMLAGKEFTISSPKQLGEVLYDHMGLGGKIKKTSTGARTTNAAQLESMKDEHPIIALILSYREISKLLSTYIDSLPEYVQEDGKIHAHYVQSGTGTGRFSCEDPNLQNLPVKGEFGGKVREAFVAGKGNTLISCDYAQIDLRSAAILSQDVHLVDIFEKGIDVHTGTAARVFAVKEGDVTSDMRRKAKAINFGILYGMGVNALKEGMHTERKEAQAFYDQYKVTFSQLIAFLDRVKQEAKSTGFTKTLLGRKRRVPFLKSALPFLRAQGERIALNAPVQGTSADVLKLAILDVHDYLKENKLTDLVKLILQIHDELVYEVDAKIKDKVMPKLVEVMEQVLSKRGLSNLPLTVNATSGDNLDVL